MRILVVLTSLGRLSSNGLRTGFRFDEFAAAYLTFIDAGAEVVVASPQGGAPPVDPESYNQLDPSPDISRFLTQPNARAALQGTLELHLVETIDFDAVFYPGGPGLLWDLSHSTVSIRLLAELHTAGRPMAFVSEGSAALCRVRDPAGRAIVAGRTITMIRGSEYRSPPAGAEMFEQELRAAGANVIRRADTTPHVISDGLLITGQNPASALEAAKLLLAAVAHRPLRDRNPG